MVICCCNQLAFHSRAYSIDGFQSFQNLQTLLRLNDFLCLQCLLRTLKSSENAFSFHHLSVKKRCQQHWLEAEILLNWICNGDIGNTWNVQQFTAKNGAARIATVIDNFRIESLHLWPVASPLLEMWEKEIHNGACAICYTRADTNLLKQARSAKGKQGTSCLSHIQIFKIVWTLCKNPMPNPYLIWQPYTKFQTVVECNCWKYFKTWVLIFLPCKGDGLNTQNLLCGTAAKLDFASYCNESIE